MFSFNTVLSFTLIALSTTNAAHVLQAAAGSEVIPNSYIVMMKANTTIEKFKSHRSRVSSKMSAGAGISSDGIRHEFNFNNDFMAYSGIFDDNVMKEIADDDDVDYIEPSIMVHGLTNRIIVQKDAPWALGRIAAKKRGNKDFIYDKGAGEGITAYVIDSGVNVNHTTFGGRATWAVNTVDKRNEDCHGHGTHVAGLISGTEYGVAKKTKVVSVKVLDCNAAGSLDAVVWGVEWALHDAKTRNRVKKSVMNLSIGAPKSRVFNDLVTRVVKAGMFVAVGAGNDNKDAKDTSPASADSVCTVGATDKEDKVASFSNFGSVVDLFAPGVDTMSAGIVDNNSVSVASGTSAASPLVAGLAAYLMSREGISGGSVCERIGRLAWNNVRNAPRDTTTKLIFNGGRNGEKKFPKKLKKPKKPKNCSKSS